MQEVSLRTQIKLYKKRAQEIESHLLAKPKEWGKFQSEFNSEVNLVFRNIMNFEKNTLAFGREDQVYKLKRLFINKIREIFVRGMYIEWSLRKPFGYAGDFKIINDIYQNNPTTSGFERLLDNYFQMSAISVAVRNRKEDFKRLIRVLIDKRKTNSARVMDIACGPCRDVEEMFSLDKSLSQKVTFDCYDNDNRAIKFAKQRMADFPQVNFFKENAVRLALKKDVTSMIDKKYDVIYSAGLFDYFEEKIAIRLVGNLKKLLLLGGSLLIANVRDKYSNPSVHFMEWVGDWNLVYRNDDDFRKVFIEAGFRDDEVETQYEQQGIMQYVIATHKG